MMNQREKYFDILKKSDGVLWNAAKQVNHAHSFSSAVEDTMAYVGGVSIYLYVSWVLEEAQKRDIKRLYFLARDGQVFYKAAQLICTLKNIDMDCRYLYCSRIAWRVPQYFLLGEKCLDYICQRSMNLSVKKMFDRTTLDDLQIENICRELEISPSFMNKVLDLSEIEEVLSKLKQSKLFLPLVYEKSQKEYENTMKYLVQEGLLEPTKYAVVDTGWVGSMQQSLGDLLSHYTGKTVRTEGFYFGLFRQPKTGNHIYHGYYFSQKSGLLRKAMFNNNLLECMCGATDGMTIGYRTENGKMYPRFERKVNINSELWDVEKNHEIVLDFVRNVCLLDKNSGRSYQDSLRISQRVLTAFMMFPSKEEAECFGGYLFSDDITENMVYELAPALTKIELLGEDFLPKVWKRAFCKDVKKRQTKSYWIEGSIRRSNSYLSIWHWGNAFIWHVLQYLSYGR